MQAPKHTFLLLLLVTVYLLHISTTHAAFAVKQKIIVLTNNHTNYLSVRCFSFNNEFDVVHLPSWGQYKFRVKKRYIYPSSTMFNCSTNMGTFIAYKFDYECSKDKYESCDWRFDEDSAYRWEPKVKSWVLYDYAPNYESLNRGGVIQGYFAN
ncbi:hypothetical protein Salat_1830400 [Sesamum alatum]|uniref:S-protein homolog n=1 Tax=Sesamum alatum TaxID=300844 RepID=A0AAE2CHQ2_9LAMI|nr:hypothetical protein Salat_1830400 [Sesamum alatum]